MLVLVGGLVGATSAPTTRSAVFHPKVTEAPSPQDIDDYEEDLEQVSNNVVIGPDDEDDDDDVLGGADLDLDELLRSASASASADLGARQRNQSSKAPLFVSNTLDNETRAALGPLFDFAEFVLRPTSAVDNVVEARVTPPLDTDEETSKYYCIMPAVYETVETLQLITFRKLNSSLDQNHHETHPNHNDLESERAWLSKRFVCTSKMVYEREGKSKFEYWFLNTCNEKPDSEFCFTKYLKLDELALPATPLRF